MEYEFEHDRVANEIKKRGWKRVVLQFPEGIKMFAFDVAENLKKRGVQGTIISGDPCFGACDLALTPIQYGVADGLVHYGHSAIPSINAENVIYVELRAKTESEGLFRRAVVFLQERGYTKESRIGLIASVQHIQSIDTACNILSEHFQCAVGKGDDRVVYPGQVLGCNFSSAESVEADAYLFIGSGDFHPLGAAISTGKEVIVADPYSGKIREVSEARDRMLRKRFAAITAASDAEIFGILAGTKIGQWRIKEATRMKEMAEKHGKKGYILSMNFLSPEALKAFKVDAWVSTACPRIALDESARYELPILTPPEFEILLGVRKWSDYRFDEIYG